MTEWLLSCCILIAAVIGLRAMFKSRISMRMRYCLWALVLLRLLIPGNLIKSEMSIGNLAHAFSERPTVQAITQELSLPQQSYENAYQEVIKEHYSVTPSVSATLPVAEKEVFQQEAQSRVERSAPIYSLKQVFYGIWILGMAIIGTFLFAINWDFSRRLKLTRRRVEADAPIPVYKSFMAETPCLFGLLRPVIYITEETASDPTTLSHILAHETTHYRHMDHIWAFLRSICLVLHWYNPLVWYAVSLSKRDCELACDEGTIARIGEENRIEYGRTLISVTCIRRAPTAALLTATTMLSDKKTLTERIRQVATKQKVVISAVIAAVIIAAVAVGCTFTGAAGTPTTPSEPADSTAPAETTAPEETSSQLSETTPSQSLDPTGPCWSAGEYTVGTDLAKGEYVFIPLDPDVPGTVKIDYLDSVEESFSGHFIWSLNNGAKLTATNCLFIPASEFTVTPEADGSYGPGMYRVGIDIPEGGYQIVPLRADAPASWKLFFSISQAPFHNDYYHHSSAVTQSIDLNASTWGAILLEDCLLVPVSGVTFTVPAAPVPSEVLPLPESYDASTLVYPYYAQGVDIVGHATYYISLPSIYPFSEDAIDCQQDIYNAVLPKLKSYEETSGYDDIYDTVLIPYENKQYVSDPSGIGYEAYLCGGVLSIVVYDKDPIDTIDHHVFNLDISTGERLNTAAMMIRFGITENEIRKALENAFLAHYPSLDSSDSFYKKQLNNTISSKNISDTRIFITNDGTLMLAAEIYSLAGANSYSELIPLLDSQSLGAYQALFDSSTPEGFKRPMALTSFYNYPSQVDFSCFFHNGFFTGDLTKSEKQFLTGKGFELNMDVQRHSLEQMDEVLLEVFGMTFAESNKVGLEKLTYYTLTDSYYSNHNSSNFPDITITRYENFGSGIVKLYYTCANQIHLGYENQEFVVTIVMESEDTVRIFANQPSR